MIPVRLQIKGFLSYYDPVDLHFDSFDLACISGSNGAGKSSLLDAITWVLFGEARRRDDTIINHRSPAAEVVLDFNYENAVYRVQRSKQKEKTATLDFFIQSSAGNWKPLTEATLRATEDRIRQTLRLDYETFTNASFFLQGKADLFAQQRPGDRKRILAAILGLETWELYKEEAARRRRGFEIELANIEGAITEIETELKETDDRHARFNALNKEYATKKELVDARKALLDQQRLISDRIENEMKRIEKQSLEIKRLHAELDRQVDDLRARQEERKQFRQQIENENNIRVEHEQWLKNQKTLAEWETIASNFRQFEIKRHSPLLKIEVERASLQTELNNLIATNKTFTTLQEGMPSLLMQVEEFQQAIKTDSDQLEMRSVLENDMRELLAEKARVKAENSALKVAMDELKERISTLQATTGAICPTCEKPLNSAERHRLMGELNLRGKEKGNAHRENQKIFEHCDTLFREKETELLALQRVDADLKLQQRLFDVKSEEFRKNQVDIENWMSNGLVRLESIQKILLNETFAQDARAELVVIDEELKKLGYDAATHEEIRKIELTGRESQQSLLQLEQAKSTLAPLEREIESLEKAICSAEEHLQELEEEFQSDGQKMNETSAASPDLSQLEKEYYSIQVEVNKLLTEVGYAQNQVDVLKIQQAQKLVKLEEKETINLKISNLKILERAFGKDGIPALLIEQALPEIESHANDILDRLSASGMSVKFETQREFRDKKRDDRKETLDILIRDSAGEREYELFSGGEAFRVNFAIRLALSRVLARRSGARLQTLVIDEGFGSQDAEGRQRLIEAINLVRTDFAKILVITHLEELKDAFSARIEVTKEASGSQIHVVSA
ncbi:MAG: hypothetical protein C0401_04350 [Anaerolinea sp.]|nr:hypothetical protein [Anaerolinea sp.]